MSYIKNYRYCMTFLLNEFNPLKEQENGNRKEKDMALGNS